MKLVFIYFVLVSYLFSSSIFVYHRFNDDRHKSTSTSNKSLIAQFEYLKKHNYKVVKLSQMIEKIKNNQSIPANWVALTIDDGYKSFYKNGFKIFKKYGYPFTMFVYMKASKKRYGDFMNFKQLKEISKYGELGLHSYSHPHLVSLSNQKILDDTKKAYDMFVKEFGYKPKYYAYPYGEFNNRVKTQIKSFGFDAIFNQNNGANVKDIYDIDRIALTNDAKIKSKLNIKALDAEFLSPQNYPKNKILKNIKAKVNSDLKNVKLYITDYGWFNIKPKNGLIDFDLNKPLKKSRVRVILKSKNEIKTKILVKGE
jgi:peptidoglycan/xylan/chitin deacetylase (PgdA/CDA1 family)